MLLKLNKNIDLNTIQQAVSKQLAPSHRKKNSFEVQLIYKIIHEYSNYEEYQWSLFVQDKVNVYQNFAFLLLEISYLDSSLTWDCLSILSRYMNLYEERHKIAKKYLRRTSK